MMKKLLLLAAALLVCLKAQATVTIAIGAGELKTSTGEPMPISGLAILVASTLDGTFGLPTPTDFTTGDDIELFRWNLSAENTPGVLVDIAPGLTLSGDWNPGDPLQLYWFPTLALGSTAPGAGTQFGLYRDPAPNGPSGSGFDGSDPWFTPADGATISLTFLTPDFGGSAPNPGLAAFATVPEPSTYALFGLALAGLGLARRFRKA